MATRNYTYRDLDLNFTAHPVRGDVAAVLDDRAVIAAVRNLVLMNRFESPFEPELGSNVRKLLFENHTPAVEALLAEMIAEVIRNHEPRVDLEQIEIQFDDGNNGYYIVIQFYIKAIPTRVYSGQFFLERAR